MSNVTNLILVTGILDADEAPDMELGVAFQDTTHMAGGNKAMECGVFQVAVNYLDWEDFSEKWKAKKWVSPESVILVINTQMGQTLVYPAGVDIEHHA